MQSSGTLTELSLDGILDTVQKDRATGTLHLRSSDGEATLYFLFGHLFHAVDAGDQQGEPVVHKALDWSAGDFTFDAKAKLPAEETITVPTSKLLANHAAAGDDSEPVTEPETEPETATEPGSNGAHASAGESEPATSTLAPEPEPAPAEEPLVDDEPVIAAAEEDQRQRRGTDRRPGTRAPETMALYPVPMGKSLHLGLTAGFVDFPKLLRSLAKDAHSGYVRLGGEGFTGVLLFSSGAVVEAIFDGEGQVSTGASAFASFGDRIDAGEGGLDVIELSPEMVTGIYQLLTAPSTYDRLLARFIKADALLEYLAEEKTSGAVIVRNKDAVGIVLFREGQVLGAYTEAAREVSETTDVVVAICEDPATEIEVRGGAVPATLPVMEPGQGASREVPSGSSSTGDAASLTPEREPVQKAPAGRAEQEPEAPTAEDAAETAEDSAVATADAEPDEAEGEPTTERDWGTAVSEMASRADAVLGTRSKKVKELLYAGNHTQDDIDSTITRISELSIMFVDPSKLSSLADEFRQIAARNA
ncbi:MAG: DUF4388 domain-containing protein [Candidatus Dormibacteria bacterium]